MLTVDAYLPETAPHLKLIVHIEVSPISAKASLIAKNVTL